MTLLRQTRFPSLAVICLLCWVADTAHGQPAPSPAPFEVVEASISELQDAMTTGRVTSAELVDAYLSRIAAYDQGGPRLNTLIRLNPGARATAEALDRERTTRGSRGPLHGIPIILKDNYDTVDMPTTAGSVALAGLVPPDDGFQVRRLREAGAVILGKSNLHELASGITSISSLGGQTRNPYDPSRNPGGSSGGTGAAIAGSLAAVGMGSDTCGSIRIPASHNNLVGLRPTKGLSSIDGIIPLAHTQDVGGPLARTIEDLAIVLDATVGRDPADEATRILDGRTLERFTDALDPLALQGARIGVLTNLFGDTAEDQDVGRVIRAAIEEMETLGAKVVGMTMPGLDELLRDSGVIAYEFNADLIAYLAVTPGAPVSSLEDILEQGLYHAALGERFRRRLKEAADDEAYREALAKRPTIRDSVVALLDDHLLDALAYPTMRTQPSKIGEPQRGSNCQLSAHSGLPALSVAAGFTANGLPAGLELLGRPFDDARLIAMGYAFERGTDHRRAPTLTPPLETGRIPALAIFTASAENPTGAALEATFRFDRTRNTLGYDLRVSGVAADGIHAVNLHRGTIDADGPVVHRLAGPGLATTSGTADLSPGDRHALGEGRLYIQLYTRDDPTGALTLPGER